MSPVPRLFRNGRLHDGQRFVGATDLRCSSDGRILELGRGLAPRPGEELRELGGRWLLPGLVDCHVHFREPGLVHKEGYATGSAGALHGGVCTVLEIQNNPPLMESAELLCRKREELRGVSRVDYAPYGSLTRAAVGDLAAMRGLVPAVKCFLGCSTGAGGVKGIEELRPLFTAAARAGLKIVAHCEDNAVLAAARAANREPEPRHDRMRPAEAEVRSVRDAIRVAEECGARLHVFHLSTAAGARLVVEAAVRGLPVSGSTAPHYLLFDAEAASRASEHRLKVNPAIHDSAEGAGLRELLAAGRLQGVGTDHAPHPLAEKARPYAQAPSGFPSVDLLLPLMVAVHDHFRVPLERLLAAVTGDPAREFDLPAKGRLEAGADADLVIADPEARHRVAERDLPSKSKWSPYQGWELRAFPEEVYLRGERVFAAGRVLGRPSGQPLAWE